MFSLLLAIIYLAFISLGLPDALLGSAWPIMQKELNVSMSYAGIVTMIIAIGTIVSSLMSDRLTRKLGTGLVTGISVLSTAIALFGFSISDSFYLLCLWAIPYGLGAGAVDAALNNYVALHYASRHMSWLHSFWGVGATISPYIMSFTLRGGAPWSQGYQTVFFIQMTLAIFLFVSLPLWKIHKKESKDNEPIEKPLSLPQALKIRGVKPLLFTFFGYCALESTSGLWASSYLYNHKGIEVETAAMFGSLFYIGITAGRFLSGFIADRLGDKKMIRYGMIIILVGIVMVLLPLPWDYVSLGGLIVIGLGSAPVYPAIIHGTPTNFGEKNSQAIIGIEMASAYLGTTLMPPLFGLIADYINIGLFPVFLLFFAIMTLFMSEKVNQIVEKIDLQE